MNYFYLITNFHNWIMDIHNLVMDIHVIELWISIDNHTYRWPFAVVFHVFTSLTNKWKSMIIVKLILAYGHTWLNYGYPWSRMLNIHSQSWISIFIHFWLSIYSYLLTLPELLFGQNMVQMLCMCEKWKASNHIFTWDGALIFNIVMH